MNHDEKVQAFTVKNSEYYAQKWRRLHDGSRSIFSFNIAACLGQVIWLAYRKLYVPLVWLTLVYIADVALTLYVEENQLVSPALISVWNWVTAILYLGVVGLLGNYWYWRKFRKIEAQAESRPDSDSQLAFIRAKGGPNASAAWGVVIVLLLPVTWALYWGVYQASKFDFSSYVFEATGPLTLVEVEANFLAFMDEPLEGARRDCVFSEVEDRARAAGDPETLDPATVEFLPAEEWGRLDPSGRRLILTQAIVTKAMFVCRRPAERKTVREAARAAGAETAGIIAAGDPRFEVFELANSAGDGTYAKPGATVLLSFRAHDSRYCRAARFSSDYTVVLACRDDRGWAIEAASSLAPGESTVATNFGGGDMSAVTKAVQALNASGDFLDEREIIEAAARGWR
jgi:hypothetical protein